MFLNGNWKCCNPDGIPSQKEYYFCGVVVGHGDGGAYHQPEHHQLQRGFIIGHRQKKEFQNVSTLLHLFLFYRQKQTKNNIIEQKRQNLTAKVVQEDFMGSPLRDPFTVGGLKN